MNNMGKLLVHNPNKLPTIPIADLLPSQGNLKDLSEAKYTKLKNVLLNRGFSVPVYIWEDDKGIKHLLDGHQRKRVMTTEGWNEPIPYLKVPAADLQEAMARLLEITSQYGTVTQEGIDQFIATYELPEAEIYEATHFDALTVFDDIDEPEIEEDEAPEVDESSPAVSKLGEVYQLGRHRLMAGSATEASDVAVLMNGDKADMVFTDPPYGISIVSGGSVGGGKLAKVTQYSEVIGDDTTDAAIASYKIFKSLEIAKMIIWGGNYYASDLPNSPCWVVWDKNNTGNFADCELAWTNMDKSAKLYKQTWNGMIREGETGARVHPTQKPIGLAEYCFKTFGEVNDKVLDVFGGSGSTLIACEQTDRTCYMLELDEKYIDVIRKRYAKFTAPDNELPENWEELTPKIRD